MFHKHPKTNLPNYIYIMASQTLLAAKDKACAQAHE